MSLEGLQGPPALLDPLFGPHLLDPLFSWISWIHFFLDPLFPGPSLAPSQPVAQDFSAPSWGGVILDPLFADSWFVDPLFVDPLFVGLEGGRRGSSLAPSPPVRHIYVGMRSGERPLVGATIDWTSVRENGARRISARCCCGRQQHHVQTLCSCFRSS